MAARATAGALEEGFAGSGVSREQFLQRIIAAHGVASERRQNARLQKCRDVGNLRIRQWESRHAFVRPAAADDRPDRASVLVVIHRSGADQIRSARAGGIVAMTEPAALNEEFLPAIHGLFGRMIRRVTENSGA